MRNNRLNDRRDRRSHTDSPDGWGETLPAGVCTAGVCTAVIGSMTQAMKAQSLLADAAIRSTIVKISSTQTHNGCAYGVDYPCPQSSNVRTVLERAGVKVRQYLQG